MMIPVAYLVISLILSLIPVNKTESVIEQEQTIFLNTNGIHLEVIIAKSDINATLLDGLKYSEQDKYISFGWGDENFYLNTPTWNDLTFSNAFKALFLNSSTLIHLTRYSNKQHGWVEIKTDRQHLHQLNNFLLNTFQLDDRGNKIILAGKGYSSTDDFYKANGSYSCFNTCNSWVNAGFKASGLKCCLWTPFDFGLLKKYQ